MRRGRTPEECFTFVGLLPDNPRGATVSIDAEVLDRLRIVEQEERRKAANRGTPVASQARHEGVATGISIVLAAIEASDIRLGPSESGSVEHGRGRDAR
jgi:hypothetical protein